MNTSTSVPLLRLYGIVPYDRSSKARWQLEELGLAYEDRWLDPSEGDLSSASFLNLNPMGRTPVLELGDTVVFESSAICAYLDDRYLDRGLAPAITSPERADYQKWMYFAAATLDSFQTRIMIIEDIPPAEVKDVKEAALVDELRDALATLDHRLSESSYLVANRFGTADICVGYSLYAMGLWPELDSVISLFPRVRAYLEGLKTRPSAIKANVFSYEE